MKQQNFHIYSVIRFKMIFMLSIFTSYQLMASPQINPFPVSVQESFKQAEGATVIIQSKMVSTSQEMKQIEKLYKISKCDQISSDSGCQELKAQMRSKFMKFNQTIQDALPEIKNAVDHAHTQMASSLRKIGNQMSPSEMVKLNHKYMIKHKSNAYKKLSHSALGRLANTFRKLNKSIGSSQTNMLALAGETYAGLSMIKEELEILDTNIKNNQILQSLSMNIDDFSDEDFNVIANFRATVMGDEQEGDFKPVYQEVQSPKGYEDRLNKYFN